MLVHREPAVPPYFTHWTYKTTLWARLRNRLGNAFVNFISRDLWNDIVAQRQRWKLPPYRQREEAYSPLAQLCQLPQAFDFPRERLPSHFHYIGRLQDPSGTEPIAFKSVSFPFDRLDERPLVYASLGTLQNQRPEIFECIAQACSTLDVQLVISLGNPQAQPINLPGNPLVVPFAPHQQLIERSQVVVTHAGMNTVLTALGCGVPLVAIPITNEQPGIAARLALSKAGKTIRLDQLDETTLRTAIVEVLTEPSYRDNAQRLQTAIQEAGRVERAADIVEQVARTHHPLHCWYRTIAQRRQIHRSWVLSQRNRLSQQQTFWVNCFEIDGHYYSFDILFSILIKTYSYLREQCCLLLSYRIQDFTHRDRSEEAPEPDGDSLPAIEVISEIEVISAIAPPWEVDTVGGGQGSGRFFSRLFDIVYHVSVYRVSRRTRVIVSYPLDAPKGYRLSQCQIAYNSGSLSFCA